MPKARVFVILGFCFFAVALIAWAQSRKAGLWEISTTTAMQQAGSRVGMFSGDQTPKVPAEKPAPLQVCLTQEQIDKYGIILPPSLRDCELVNVISKPNSLTADMTCSGRFNGKGSIESTWTDEEHAAGKVRFVAKTKQGAKTYALGWTQEATGVFKSANCGGVRPRAVPNK